MDKDNSRLFVYGTLLSGTGSVTLDRFVRRCLTPITRAWVPGRLFNLGHYPGAIPDSRSGDKIHGVIAQIRYPRFSWPHLDRYEDCGSLYVRDLVIAFDSPGEVALSCWIYRYQGPVRNRERIRSGDYLAFRRRRYCR